MNPRQRALSGLSANRQATPDAPQPRVSTYYASRVFGDPQMRQFLSPEAYKAVKNAVAAGTKIDRETANAVAAGMKAWALEMGATHYSHWFQPLTGATAEKHDSFFTIMPGSEGMERFDGDALVQQEPDASSFPSGGLRNTFEARGYTAWDPGSPAFIMEVGNGRTLCIPTIFISYTGEALDYKMPLLRSMQALETAAVDVCRLFDKSVNRVTATLGWEQEYFLIDEGFFEARPDLVAAGRTLIGHPPAKGQQLEDHYFGSIPERAYMFMTDLEAECFKLGIPLKTRHNEVAPSQFECAPHFEEVNVAIDHNQLLMDLMDRVARRHRLRVLLHEKPFAGINGSGKHNNWSMSTDAGKNLLSPGSTPKTNLQFLTFFINVVKAVHDHSDLIRASIASAGNDHRLGANEAPPAIISVFIGDFMTEVLNEIETRAGSKDFDTAKEHSLRLDLHNKIPDVLLDNTDRNRTSPFAFTGNKFEVRAVGSSANCSNSMLILNTIVADTLRKFKADVDDAMKKGENREVAIMQVLKQYITSSKKICFEGNNYSEEWAKEAAKRGLPNIKTTPPALDALVSKKAVSLFEDNKVFTKEELHARHEIMLEDYIKKVQIESRTLSNMALNHVLPCSISYLNEILSVIKNMKELGHKKEDWSGIGELAEEISSRINVIKKNAGAMTEARKSANEITDSRERAMNYCDQVKPYFDLIREECDKLEMVVDDSKWTLPKYREMLFLR